MSDLGLPLSKRITFSVKTLGIGLFIVLVVIATAALFALRRGDLIKRLWAKVSLKDTEIEIAKLQAKRDANADKLKADAQALAKLQHEFSQLEKDRVSSRLTIEGKSNEEVAAELRRLGY